MITSPFVLPMLLIVLDTSIASFLSTRAAIGAFVERHGTMSPPMIGAVRDA